MVDPCEIGMSRVPILVILGATGSGKSRLGIELAQRFSGEIISADSMQVYKGLDIITAKVSKEEQAMAPHHMLDICDALTHFSVVDFRNKALPIMNDLLSRDKMPVIVGGTNYYIESLLWQVLVQDPEEPVKDSNNDNAKISSDLSFDKESDNVSKSESDNVNVDERDDDEQDPPTKKMKFEESNEELHRKLAAVDPEMASRLHPNNRRKIIRSLQVYEDYGMRHSEILQNQRLAGGSGLGGPLRHQNTIIFWLQCDQKVLDARLNARVDSMLEAGLVKELLDFHERYNQDRIKNNELPDYTKGIFQSIGFKEFHEYLILSKEQKESEMGMKLLQQGIHDLKLVTRRYARKQQRWVLNRFIRRADRQVPPVYSLDCTNVKLWDNNVLGPAVAIISAKLKGETPSQKPLNEKVQNEKKTDSSNEKSHFCEPCQRILIGELQWNAHLQGAKHRRVVQKKKSLEKKSKADKKPDTPKK